MNAYIVTIGDELLIGQVIDSNSAWMAQQLNLAGIHVHEILTVDDSREGIEAGLKRAMDHSDLILLTGGLGPTKDDITKKTLADYMGAGMVFHQPTYDRILKLFERWGRSTTEAHRLQCYMPDNATVLLNKMGTAPGMWFEHNGKTIVSMPGVPYEMKYLMEYEVIPKIKEQFQTPEIRHRTILTVGEGESRIARRIEPVENQLPAHIKLAYLPGMGMVRLRLSGSGMDAQALEKSLDEQVAAIEAIIPEFIFGYENETLEQVVGRMLKDAGLLLGSAESCTGGYVSHRITAVPGSSAYFSGSVIAYANEVKVNLLGVQPATLEKHGAVSEQTVIEMVEGTCKALGTDIALATSGIAGPGGGTEEKPVGTIWMAVGRPGTVKTRLLKIGKDRERNIKYTSTQVLNMVREFVIKELKTVDH